jgi:hypothetical protein
VKREGVWATSAAREEFTEADWLGCIDDYSERGPQFVAAGGEGFAFYKFTDGRELLLVERRGKVSVMTQEEFREAQRELRKG